MDTFNLIDLALAFELAHLEKSDMLFSFFELLYSTSIVLAELFVDDSLSLSIEVLLSQKKVLISLCLILKIEELLKSLVFNDLSVTEESMVERLVLFLEFFTESTDIESHQTILILLNELLVRIKESNNGGKEHLPYQLYLFRG